MRKVQSTGRFDRLVELFMEAHPDLRKRVLALIDSLAEDAFAAKHKTHRLSGELKGLWSASINYHFRIVFVLTDESIIFVSIGSHDEVY